MCVCVCVCVWGGGGVGGVKSSHTSPRYPMETVDWLANMTGTSHSAVRKGTMVLYYSGFASPQCVPKFA